MRPRLINTLSGEQTKKKDSDGSNCKQNQVPYVTRSLLSSSATMNLTLLLFREGTH